MVYQMKDTAWPASEEWCGGAGVYVVAYNAQVHCCSSLRSVQKAMAGQQLTTQNQEVWSSFLGSQEGIVCNAAAVSTSGPHGSC